MLQSGLPLARFLAPDVCGGQFLALEQLDHAVTNIYIQLVAHIDIWGRIETARNDYMAIWMDLCSTNFT